MAYHDTNVGRIWVTEGYNVGKTKLLLELCKDECKTDLGQFEDLLKNGADPNSHLGGWTPLMWASRYGKTEVVELFLRYKADVHISDRIGKTALHIACDNGKVEVVQLLLQHGAPVDEKDVYLRTALHWACAKGNVEVAGLLIQHKASIDVKDRDGWTHLHIACYNGHMEMIQLLLQHKASVDEKNNFGMTPLDWARRNGHNDIVTMLEEGDFSTPAPAKASTTNDNNNVEQSQTDPVSQSEGDGEKTPCNELPQNNNPTTSSQDTPKEFVLPELNTPNRYKCVAHSALGLVYLPATFKQTVSFEPITDSKHHPNLESNEILLTPVVSLSSQQVALDRNQPAIIELTKSIEPTDLNPNRQLVPICSSTSSLQWKELASRDCEMLPDRIRFKTTQFGYLSVKVRFPFPSASTTVDPKIQHQARIEIQELPGFKVEVPSASVQSATEIKATVLYDSPRVAEQFKESSLASTCVRLEPDGSQFKEKVKISLPIPNYSRIKQKYPDAKLEVWLSQSTDEGVPIAWEQAPFTTHIDENGNCLATASITHFSFIEALWNRPVDFVMNFFTSQVRDRCQVFMSAEKRIESLLTFSVTVLLYPFNEPCPVLPNYPYLLCDSVRPIDVAVGDVECQLDLNEIILRTFSINRKQKSHKESVSMSRDGDMRAEFSMELSSDATSSELPAGTTVATLLIKHGSEKNRPHKFTLIKPLESAVDQAKVTPSPATVKAPPTLPKRPLESSVDSAKVCLEAVEKAADGLKKTTKEMKQQSVLTLSARRIAKHMQKVTKLASNTSGFTEGDKITYVMQLIVKESEEIEKVSKQLAEACTETKLRENLEADVTKIPGLSQSLKHFLRTVEKKQYGERAAQYTDLLTTNATNLRSVVEAVLYAADRAIIKVPKSDLERFVPKGMMLSVNDLHKVQTAAWEARAKWYNCGLALGLTAGTLDAIRETHRGVCDNCFTEILKEWLHRGHPPPSWISLCIALEDPSVGYDELAENLEPNAY